MSHNYELYKNLSETPQPSKSHCKDKKAPSFIVKLKNFANKILHYIKDHVSAEPNKCQKNASLEIEKILGQNSKTSLKTIFKKKNLKGLYLHGSVGVGKSILLKAIHYNYKRSEIFHFSDLIFYIQKKKYQSINGLFKKVDLFLIDEFYINNLANIILFKDFLIKSFNKKKIIIMSGNKEIHKVYYDPVNSKICDEIRNFLNYEFISVKMDSKIDYRESGEINQNFFFTEKNYSKKKQDLLRQRYSPTSLPVTLEFKRTGNKFLLDNVYGNVLDEIFNIFFKKNLVFQDYVIMLKKINFFIIRKIPQMNDDSKDVLLRFISFVDVIYDNKNILSISSKVELNKLYIGKSFKFEFKRTISRLKEMGSDSYINCNLNKIMAN